ncbi:MAG: head-tail adaptor protein [Clostridiales bacterium]
MIGGNSIGRLQQKTTGVQNAIGERVDVWMELVSIKGFLDYSSGESGYLKQKAKVDESTHIFMCDYQVLDLDATNKRMVIDNKYYDVLLMDDPMGIHSQLEIYLRYLGGDTHERGV